MSPQPLEPGQAVAQLRQLDLQLGLVGLGTPGKNVHDQLAAVDHRFFRDLLDVVLLGGAQVVVGDDEVDIELLRELGGLGNLSRSAPGRRVGAVELLDQAVKYLDVSGFRERDDFRQWIDRGPVVIEQGLDDQGRLVFRGG